MAQLCERLVALGIPLWRTALFVRTLHPEVMGRRLTCRPDTGVETSEAGFAVLETDNYLASPVVYVYATGLALRRRLAAADCPADLGEVLFGNIGGGDRLDFTCIGPAVNLAARIEKLTGETGHPILASREFARHCSADLVPVGEFALRGFGTIQAVFGLEQDAD